MTDVAHDDLLWLAGLLEGEGCFVLESGGHGRKRRATIQLQMTDLDVLERAASIMQVHAPQPLLSPSKLARGGKSSWRVRATHDKAKGLMRELLPHMGRRRSAKIREVLDV